jgi:hypothetical protein
MSSAESKAARRVSRAIPLVLSLLAPACSGSIEIATTPLAGVVGGTPWTLASAESSAFLSEGSPTFYVTAYAESLTPCTGAGASVTGNLLLLNVPKTPGDFLLSPGLSQTFYVRANNLNLTATDGRIRVDKVDDSSVSGGAHFRFDGSNEVDGVFTVPICP